MKRQAAIKAAFEMAVTMQTPDGELRMIPAESAANALAAGGQVMVKMADPNGALHWVPMRYVEEAISAGGWPMWFEKYSEEQPRDDHGRWTSEGVGFVSPNVQENTTFSDAQRGLASEEQKQAHALAQRVVEKVAGKGEVHDTIGEWKDGAENSLMVRGPMDRESTKYVAALMGKAENQKASSR